MKNASTLIEESDNVRVVLFPPEILAFQVELAKHPDLLAKLNPEMTWLEKIETLSAELEIALDGMYKSNELTKLFTILIQRMRERSIGLLILPYSDVKKIGI